MQKKYKSTDLAAKIVPLTFKKFLFEVINHHFPTLYGIFLLLENLCSMTRLILVFVIFLSLFYSCHMEKTEIIDNQSFIIGKTKVVCLL